MIEACKEVIAAGKFWWFADKAFAARRPALQEATEGTESDPAIARMGNRAGKRGLEGMVLHGSPSKSPSPSGGRCAVTADIRIQIGAV
jgi:hypothetical protein